MSCFTDSRTRGTLISPPEEQTEACKNVSSENKQQTMKWMHDLSLFLTVLHQMKPDVQL